MSELMDEAVIRMPFDMAMESELSRKQFYDRANALLSELTELRAKLAAMESQKPTHIIDWEFDDDPDDADARGDLIVHKLNGAEYPAGTPLYAKPVPADKPVTRQDVIDVLLSTRGQSEGVTADAILGLLSDKVTVPPDEIQLLQRVSASTTDKPAGRITEKDAREIALSAITCAKTDVSSWLQFLDGWASGGDLRELLNKLNAEREQVPAAAVPEPSEQDVYRWFQESTINHHIEEDGSHISKRAMFLAKKACEFAIAAAPSHSQQSARITRADQFIDGRYYWCKFTNRNAVSYGETVIWKYSQNGRDAPFLAHHPVDAEFFEKAEIYGPVPMPELYSDRCPIRMSDQQNKQSIWSGGRVGNAE